MSLIQAVGYQVPAIEGWEGSAVIIILGLVVFFLSYLGLKHEQKHGVED